jgi:hypothetical protein
VAAGDLVILPRGEAHVMKDSKDSAVLWLNRILAETPAVNGRLSHGRGVGQRSELLRGGFVVEQLTAQPLLGGASYRSPPQTESTDMTLSSWPAWCE